jgi:hypothetical protein
VNYSQDNWVEYLPMAEFEANTAISESSKISPMEATKGYQPMIGFEPPAVIQKSATSAQRTEQQSADKLVDRMNALRLAMRNQLRWSQELQKHHADNSRQPAPRIIAGDYVLISTKNIHTERPNKSLDAKFLGPYKVKRVINDYSYEIDLPHGMRIFPVFHPWLLQLYEGDPLQGQVQAPEGPVFVKDGEDYYGLQEIVDCKMDKRRLDHATGLKGLLMYRAHFEGDDAWNERPPWQEWWYFMDSPYMVADFHHKHPEKPKPHISYKRPADWTPPS